MRRAFLRMVLVALLLLPAALAEAQQSARLPRQGNPAIAVDVPAGWNVRYDDLGNLLITAVERYGGFSISMIEEDAVATRSLPDYAAAFLKEAKYPPFQRAQATTLAGRSGQDFFTVAKNSSGVGLNVRVILVKLDGTHLVSVTRITAVGSTAAQEASMDALLARMRFVGLK